MACSLNVKMGALALLGAGMLVGCSALGITSKDSVAALDDFEKRLARYSEDVLSRQPEVDEEGTVLVATIPCKQEDRIRLDAMFPISEARQLQSETINAPFGLPLVDDPKENEFFLYQDEYILLYNSDLKLPVFATYRLRSDDIQSGDRLECFRPDPRLKEDELSKTTDYHGSTDLDKGHLVPDADMQRSADTVMNTYFMSNMMPQFGSVNSGSWLYLENAARLWADELDEVLIVSGTIFDRDGDGIRDADADAERAPPSRRVAKPTAFYKIVMTFDENDTPRAIAFMLPHIQDSTAPNRNYVPTKLVSIDEIEAISGFDFFSELSDDTEEAMEKFTEDDLWCRRECNGTL